MLRIAILDDNEYFAEDIRIAMVDVTKQLNLVCEINLFYEAEHFLNHMDFMEGEIKLVVLDINLKDANGIKIAQYLNSKYPQTKVIFITAYNDYSQDISEAEFAYYLLKPLDKNRFFNAVQKAVKAIETEEQDFINISVRGRISRINVHQIEYAESRGRIVTVFSQGENSEAFNIKLDELEKILSPYKKFLRIHQSYLINMDTIKVIEKTLVKTYSGQEFVIPQKKLTSVKGQYMAYLNKKY